jgi:hypothetical protein
MCGANVKVANKGVLRRPSARFMKELVDKHVNKNVIINKEINKTIETVNINNGKKILIK